MALKLGASEPAIVIVWILLVLALFSGSWAITGTNFSLMREFSTRLGWDGCTAWYDTANYDYLITWRGPRVGFGKQGDLWKDHLSFEKTHREAIRDLVTESRWSLTGAETGRKSECMTLFSLSTPWLTLSYGHSDTPPRRVLPLAVVVVCKIFKYY